MGSNSFGGLHCQAAIRKLVNYMFCISKSIKTAEKHEDEKKCVFPLEEQKVKVRVNLKIAG